MAVLDFRDIGQLVRGALDPGKLKLVPECIAFKSSRSGEVSQFNIDTVESLGWMKVARGYELKVFLKDDKIIKFDGFKESDYQSLQEFSKKHFGKDIPETEVSFKGWNWGEVKFHGPIMAFQVENRTAFEVPLQDVSQVTTGKNEVTMEFHQSEHAPVSLLEMRFYIPNTGEDEDNVQMFYDKVMQKADVVQATGDAITVFEELQVLTPRGRYDFTAYPTFIQLHGKTYDYKIPYDTITKQFLLPNLEQRQMFFVIGLDPPLRQGQTRYPFVIMQFSLEEDCSLTLPFSEEELQDRYGDKLTKSMSGALHEVFSRVMRAVSGKKITIPESFKGPSGQANIHCSHRATSGLLYPMDRGFLFIHKPAVYVKYSDIGQLNFARMQGTSGVSRSFDLEIEMKTGISITFSSIRKDDYGHLYDFVTGKNIRIKDKGKGRINEEADVAGEHDPYLARMKAEGEERDEDSEDEDSDFVAGDVTDDDLEFDSDAIIESNDESDEGTSRKRKASRPSQPAKKSKHDGGETKRKQKVAKDPNAPKRPLTAFMAWLGDNRERIKEENPNINVKEVAKIGGERWKTAADKKKYEEKASAEFEKYKKAFAEYKKTNPQSKQSPVKPVKSSKSPKKKTVSAPSSKKGDFKSAEFIKDSDEELEETTASTSRTKRRKDTDLVELPEEGSDEELEETTASTSRTKRRKDTDLVELPEEGSDEELEETTASTSRTKRGKDTDLVELPEEGSDEELESSAVETSDED